MKKRIYEFKYIFIETNTFNKNSGKISESVRDRLYFDLILGRGEFIEGTGGLKEIQCGIGGADGKTGWDLVFADYNYPEIKEHIYFLLAKFPINITNGVILSQEQKTKLRMIKEKLDEFVDRYYWDSYG